MKEKIEILIAKYCTNQIKKKELYELNAWLNSNELNKNIFQDYIAVNYDIEGVVFDKSEKLQYTKVEANIINKGTLIKLPINRLLKYAAVFVGLLVSVYLFKDSFKFQPELKINDLAVKLTNDEGIIQEIDVSSEKQIVTDFGDIFGLQIGKELIYQHNHTGAAEKKLIYNELTVPYGKNFKLTLTDGTQIDLNAGSSIKYPVKFLEGQDRKVYLNGEAYFAVAKDVERPFIVNTQNLDIRVLGTQFNVSSYKDDETNFIVLLEGSVAVKKVLESKNDELLKTILLEPGQKASVNSFKKDPLMNVEDVSIAKYVSWKQGELLFVNDLFKGIIKKLERHYNVEIICNNEELLANRFTGRFNKETILEVLKTFTSHTDFNYTITNNQIIIQ